jgi:hypothetical protein
MQSLQTDNTNGGSEGAISANCRRGIAKQTRRFRKLARPEYLAENQLAEKLT